MPKKKVITVSGDSNKWYDKVIFVVKKEDRFKMENIDFVEEAEKIISDYLLKADMQYTNHPIKMLTDKKTKKSFDKIDFFLFLSILVCLLVLGSLVISL